MASVYEAFSLNDRTITGKALGDFTVDFCKTMAGADVSQAGMTLTELGVGKYVLMNPNITERTVISLYLTSDSSVSASILMDPVDGDIAAQSTLTDATYGLSALHTDIGTVPAGVLAATAEGTLTVVQVLRILLAVLAGKVSGGGTTSIAFRDVADSKARVTATVTAVGNRTTITLDGA